MSCSDPELRYVRLTPTGDQYVTQIMAHEPDRRTRAAFRELVLRIAPPGARLFDFGAGPGIDARFFAERGFTVDAYDIDPRMREFFAAHCDDLMRSGHITLDSRSYREFMRNRVAENEGRADLIISNFAPLNLVDDLHELFEKFHELAAPTAKVLASVLNPHFIGDMRSRLWWRRAPSLWRNGELFMSGPQAPHYRRLPRHFRAASAPHFRLSRVLRGSIPASAADSGADLHRDASWLRAARCRYIFLLFERSA